jgi:hypothetical protein
LDDKATSHSPMLIALSAEEPAVFVFLEPVVVIATHLRR